MPGRGNSPSVHRPLADGRPRPGIGSAIRDVVGDDYRGREEEEAEDEVPDEAVSLPASDAGGPERDHDPDHRKDDVPDNRHDVSPQYQPPNGGVRTEQRPEAGYRYFTVRRHTDGAEGTNVVSWSGSCVSLATRSAARSRHRLCQPLLSGSARTARFLGGSGLTAEGTRLAPKTVASRRCVSLGKLASRDEA